ncbi:MULTISPECIES: type VI secretion system Vgr family protein [Providencia]|uniref:type VI secretion system Vgr family protein n=1 Tax=Providencia TaxID=586 RepID=UPI0009ED70A9|nr:MULTISPECIES: type VI secretion system Vgr family protein [Providencia]MBP6124064.1 type VI secretion system tip protein VgrG [Providencia sp.]NIH22704.1 type VI secretion system tip protein VgrG [Providencia heimbachae]
MSLMDTTKNLLQGQNRYRLEVQGCDALLDVDHFSGREAISDTYRYQVTFTCSAQDLSPQQLLRRSATLTFAPPLNSLMGLATEPLIAKRVHGVVTDFRRLSGSVDEARYQLVIEPFFALLRHEIRSHRFFINQSIPDVVEQILREHNFKGWEFEFKLEQNYPKREQINQINESDRQFIERLISEVGIFYRFRLQDDTQTEVIHFSDSQRGYVYEKSLPLNSPSGMNDNYVDSVWGLSLRHQVIENSVLTKDYNHRQAQDTLISAVADMTRGDGEALNYGDVYHYQARHLTRGDKLTPEAETANFWARLDHERFLTRQTLLRGESSAADLSPLLVLSITDNQLTSTLPSLFKAPILLTRLRFTGGRDKALQVKFDAIPYSETLCFRPILKPRPVIAGTLMARVTSAKDNDIYAHQNEHGFYWVKFDADRDDKKMGYESMPVRLAKPYAGDTYGMHFPLIQGTEVAIAFHEGDPDRPYIAHALHDSRHPDHITDKNNTRNIIRTPANNKLRMEDKRGEEHIKISTEYAGKTQLNLGHLVDSSREKRGDGFELRTDSWGAIRAGKGLFISTDKQEKAGGEVLAMDEAIQQLEQALAIARSLSKSAETSGSVSSDMDAQDKLKTSLTDLAAPGVLVHAPAGIGVFSPQAIHLSSGQESLALTANHSVNITANKTITLNARDNASIYAQSAGINAIAKHGDVKIEAQNDNISLFAKKKVFVESLNESIHISAKKEIILSCGGAYIKIAGGNVEIGTPKNIILKTNNIQKMGPADLQLPSQAIPTGFREQFTLKDENSNEILVDTLYSMTTEDGEIYEGKSDADGKTVEIYTSTPQKISIKIHR